MGAGVGINVSNVKEVNNELAKQRDSIQANMDTKAATNR